VSWLSFNLESMASERKDYSWLKRVCLRSSGEGARACRSCFSCCSSVVEVASRGRAEDVSVGSKARSSKVVSLISWK
jgi:hypothetical protein